MLGFGLAVPSAEPYANNLHQCTSLQTDNHTNTSSFSFYSPYALPGAQPTVSKHWRYLPLIDFFSVSSVVMCVCVLDTCVWLCCDYADCSHCCAILVHFIACPMRALRHNVPVIRFLFWSFILFAWLCRMLPHLSFFFSFHYLSPPLHIFSFENRPGSVSKPDVVKGD